MEHNAGKRSVSFQLAAYTDLEVFGDLNNKADWLTLTINEWI